MLLKVKSHHAGVERFVVGPVGSKADAHYRWAQDSSLTNPLARDLITIVRSIHLADRLIPRDKKLGNRLRRVELTIPVEDARWSKAIPLLEELACFVSADEWRIRLNKISPSRTKHKISSETPTPRPDVVALFSGGLDSLCGAAFSAENLGTTLFVTHSPPGHSTTKSLIREIWQAFSREDVPQSFLFRLRPSHLRQGSSPSLFREHTRRTRPLFFAGLAAAVAAERGVVNVQMAENGALALNLPYRFDAHGAALARQASSFMLARLASLLDEFLPLESPWNLFNPLERMTKGEACSLLKGAEPLAARTVSCEYVKQQAGRVIAWKDRHPSHARNLGNGPQCGSCLPCIVRRAALKASAIADPNSAYFFDARQQLRVARGDAEIPRSRPSLYDRVQEHPFYMDRFARRILSMSPAAFATEFAPELRLVRPTFDSKAADPKNLHDLAIRYAKEQLTFLQPRTDWNDFKGT